MKRSFLGLWVLCFIPMRLFAWTNGELLIWMDTDRGHALKPIAQRFEKHFGIKATIETPEKITDSFSLAAQAAKGPDSDGAFPTGGVAIPGYFGIRWLQESKIKALGFGAAPLQQSTFYRSASNCSRRAGERPTRIICEIPAP
jgi:hypothetical protein